MSRRSTSRYLICYDIRDDKRRNEIAKILEDFGVRVQFSVFECDLKEPAFLKVRRRLVNMMDQELDSVRVYALCRRCESAIEIFGTGTILSDEEVVIV
ncbi:MAG: CRISPR-associated endonuclease Cas2 [Deltaproteobacteria bacterium]|nr:CRISPR-associated endonuclease Cas2 [Deltaproteobacteria bacterium]